MSAHVVPKAKPSPEYDEENEKTTVESGWEEEASTTVEQGEVAEKIRDLVEAPRRPATGLTNTGNETSTNLPSTISARTRRSPHSRRA